MVYSLAAYSVYRELYGNNKFKNTKEVLKLFINYVLEEKNIICFSVQDVHEELQNVLSLIYHYW